MRGSASRSYPEIARLAAEVVEQHREVVDREQRVRVAVAQRAPLLEQGLALERQRVAEPAEVGEELGRRVDRGDRVGVAVAERGAAAGELLLREGLRLLELSQLVQEQREVVDRLERVRVVLAELLGAQLHLLAAQRLGGLEVAKVLEQLRRPVDEGRRRALLRGQPVEARLGPVEQPLVQHVRELPTKVLVTPLVVGTRALNEALDRRALRLARRLSPLLEAVEARVEHLHRSLHVGRRRRVEARRLGVGQADVEGVLLEDEGGVQLHVAHRRLERRCVVPRVQHQARAADGLQRRLEGHLPPHHRQRLRRLVVVVAAKEVEPHIDVLDLGLAGGVLLNDLEQLAHTTRVRVAHVHRRRRREGAPRLVLDAGAREGGGDEHLLRSVGA